MTIANSIVLVDNGFGTIGSGLAVGDTALAFTTGHGARFPVVAAGQVLNCVLINATNVMEEVQITAHSSGADSATMVRGANSTTAKTWTAGDRIEARLSSEILKRLQREALKKITLSTADGGATYTGTDSPTNLGYVTGLVYALTAATTNSGAGPTITLDSLTTITVVLDGGTALVAGQMPINGLYVFDGTNFILLNPAISSILLSSKVGNFTRDLTAASGNVSYTGVGFKPTSITLLGALNNETSDSVVYNGFADSAKSGSCLYLDATAVAAVSSAANLIKVVGPGSAANLQTADVNSYDADGFTLAWTKTNTPTGVVTFRYIAYK